MIKVPESLFCYFEQAGITRTIPPGGLIYMQGEPSGTIYLIKKGRVRIYYIADDGREVTLAVAGAGRLIGDSSFLAQSSRPTTVSAVPEVQLISCTTKSLMPYLMQSEELCLILFQLLTDTCNYLCSQVRRLTLYNRHQKVASFLLDETETPNPDRGIIGSTLPYSHEELAICVGLSRVTVTKILNEFCDAGYIELGYRKITVTGRAGLESLFT